MSTKAWDTRSSTCRRANLASERTSSSSESPMPADSADAVAEIAHEVLGERPSLVEHIPTLEDSTVFRLRLSSGDVFFKTEHEGHPIAAAAWAYDRAASVG